MGNIVKFSTPVSVNSIKSGGFNIGVNGTPADLTGFYTGICPINGGYTIYIDKASNGPSIYTPNNDTQLINITKGLGGNVTTAGEALVWINSQSNMTVVNSNYPSIVTDGLVLNLDAGFVSSYPKGGTGWRDLSGNGNNGTLINGSIFSSDNEGTLTFDGIDDYISLGDSKTTLIQAKTNFTIGIMFKMTTLASLRGLIGTLNYECGSNLGLVASSSSLNFYNDTNACYNVSPAGFSIEAGKWIYAVGTYDGTTTRIYAIKDNVLYQGSGTSKSGPTNTFTSDFRVMGNQYPLYFTNGECVMAFAYNRTLSQQEILQNYYAGLQRFIPTNGLVLSLDAQNTNLYATSTTTAYDISGNGNNGALINGVQYVGDVDGSWRFDATDDRIYAVSNVLITNDFTFTVWAKRDGNSSTSIGGIFGNHIHTELSGANIYFSNNSTTVTMSAGNGVTRPAHNVSIPRLNTLWNFYVIRYSGTTYQLYFNGVLLDSRTAPVVQSLNTNKYSLGVWALSYLSEYYLNGKISQCSTYNRALTATEISTIYNATKSRYGL